VWATGLAADFFFLFFFLAVEAVVSEGVVVARTRPVNSRNTRKMGEMAITRMFIDCANASN
jgi:hypothetical protein